MSFLKSQITEEHCVVSMSRPEKRNAFHPDMIEEITQKFKELSVHPTLRAIVLRGEGKSFCAGADIDWMKSMIDYTERENMVDSQKLFGMFNAIWECPIPVIAVAQGHVMGGATGLLAASDVALADEKTVFAFSEVKLGLAPAVISPFVMQKVSSQGAHRYFLTGERFNTHVASQIGLTDFVGSEKEVEGELTQLLNNFYANGPSAVRATKRLLRKQCANVNLSKDFTSREISKLRVSEEGQLGLRGFTERVDVPWRKSWPTKGSN